MENMQETVQNAKDAVTTPLPSPPDLQKKSSASDLKDRLNWGEPALTIIDVRNHDAFRQERIMGAANIPMSQLVAETRESLEKSRDIYVYGSSDEEAENAVAQLREAGFSRVAQLEGGLSAWKSVEGSIEGIAV
ncbi:MAG TPA: rhodanese-like domain-containing protein [Elainellaceae cyanobacterium]